MKYYIIVDYPNLISRIIELNIKAETLAKKLSLNALLNRLLRKEYAVSSRI